MPTLISSLKLAVSSAVLGLTVFNIKPVTAQTIFQQQIISGADNYSDLSDNDITNGFSDFIQVGSREDPSLVLEEVAFINWDLSSIIGQINDLRNDNPNTDIILGNLNATVTLTQTKSDPNNPNDADPPPFGQNGRFLPDVPRIDNINAFQVVDPGSWSESQAINTGMNGDGLPPRNNLILFNGNIQANPNENEDTFQNNYGGIGLNQVITSILNDNLDSDTGNDNTNLSITLEATEIVEDTSIGFNALESFFSQDSNNDFFKPRLTVSYELLQEGTNADGGPNFKAQTRGGGTGSQDWELGVFPTRNGQDALGANDLKQAEWTWINGQEVEFELVCDPDTGGVSMTLNNGQITSTTSDLLNVPCDQIDGLKMFSTARTNGAEMDYAITEYTTLNGNVVNIPDLSVSSQQSGSRFVEDFFAFPGVVGEQLGATNIKGTVTMSWGPGGAPQSPRSGSKNQTFLIPLTKILNLNSLALQSVPQLNQPTSQEVRDQRLEQLGLSSSVPEPNSIVALAFFATGGGALKLLSRKTR
ncbi:MAG: choice-of-anchor W domain-containing protein [Crocosphaera sp.]